MAAIRTKLGRGIVALSVVVACGRAAAVPPWTITRPSDWRVVGPCEVASPEDAVRVKVFEIADPDGERALATAWRTWRPGVTWKPDGPLLRPPPPDGWSAQLVGSFVTPDGKRVQADVRRLGTKTWVVLAEGDAAALDRRAAQIAAVADGLAPPGLAPESFAGRTPGALEPAALDAFVDATRERLGVPGVAVAIVTHDSVRWERTSGVRVVGGRDPFGKHTRALVGSVTKPMTTLMQASLVDAGTLRWDTPVTELMPSFALGDPALTAQLRLWHMSCACTGMPRRDLEYLFEWSGVTPEQRIASMRDMRPTTALGEVFQYSNLMVAAGGFIAAHAFAPQLSLSAAYAKAMHDRVFAPIGMDDARIDFAEATQGDVAAPHAVDAEGNVRALPIGIEGNVTAIAPAGAVWASLVDLERYAQTELGHGAAANGNRVASEGAWKERLVPRAKESTYGLGIDVTKESGLRVVGHDGGSLGFGTTVYLLPDLDVGLVVLTNARHGGGALQLPFNDALKRRLLEALFPGAREVAPVIVAHALELRTATVAALADVERAPEPAWLAKLAGTYAHPTLGTVVVSGTMLDAGEWKVRFGRRGERLVVLEAPFAGSSWDVGSENGVPTLSVPDPQTPAVFRRHTP